MDTRGKPRMPMRQFMNDFFVRQYGVRAVAMKAVADFAHSLRHYVSATLPRAEQEKLENFPRISIFASMCAFDGHEHAWRARKVNFLLFFLQVRDLPQISPFPDLRSPSHCPFSLLVFLQGVVGRDSAAAIKASKGDANKRIEAIRERLTKRRNMCKLASISAELTRLVVDVSVRVETAQAISLHLVAHPCVSPFSRLLTPSHTFSQVRTELIEKAQEMSHEDGKQAQPTLVVDLDRYMLMLIGMWEQGEKDVEVRRLKRLETIIQTHVEEDHAGDGGTTVTLISYEEFELIVKDVRKRAGAETHEEHLEMLMDLFDEALQESERLLGEESGTQSPNLPHHMPTHP